MLPSIRRVSYPPGLPANNWGSRTEAAVKKGIDTPKAKIVYYCNDIPCGFVGGGMRGGVLPNRPNMLEEFWKTPPDYYGKAHILVLMVANFIYEFI